MNVIVDTSVWSHVLRRPQTGESSLHDEMQELIREGRVVMLGPIRQELLSGLRTEQQVKKLRDGLRAFPDYRLVAEDFEEAAACFNRCRSKGIQGSNTDFLICSVGIRNDFEIFTIDGDFENFAKAVPVKLYSERLRRR
jgi:predicted nucleic acid-binding protein